MARDVLVVVHGMGDPGEGDTQRSVADQLAELINARGRGAVERAGDDGTDLFYAGRRWQVVEQWWARDFQPPGLRRVIEWIVWRLIAHLGSLTIGAWHGVLDILRGPRDPWPSLLSQLFAAPLYLVIFLMLGPLALLMVPVAPLILRVPGLRDFAQTFLGDIYMYFDDERQAAAINGDLQSMLRRLGEDRDVGRVVLLAHSTGTVIVYEALAALAESGADGAVGLRKVQAFVSTGAILNMAWNRRIVRHERFRRPIPSAIHWYNLWTRFDYGAAGPIEKTNKPWLHETGLKNRRVDNYGSLLLDHTGYAENMEQVTSVLLEEIGGLAEGNDFWRGESLRDPEDWSSRSPQAWVDWSMRRRAVGWLTLSRLPLLAGVAFLPVMLLTSVLGATVATRLALSVGVIAGAWGFHYVVARYWWKGWFRSQRAERHEAFERWRSERA